MGAREDEFSKHVKQRLADRAGTLCSNPDCRRHTKGPSSEGPDAVANIGEAAHICAASSGGARWDGTMSSHARSSIENGIWLCGSCHNLVDADPVTYPAERLRQWKRDHEAKMADTLGRRGAYDRELMETIARVFGVRLDSLESFVSMSSTPEETASPPGVEFVVSAMYSSDKDAIIVVGEIGNASTTKLTIRDVRLTVPHFGELYPEPVLVPGAFYVEGHTWLGPAPYEVTAGSFAKVAWYFNVATRGVGAELESSQPIPCRLDVKAFPSVLLAQEVDLYSIARLRELSANQN